MSSVPAPYDDNQPRHGNGRFANKHHPEASVTLQLFDREDGTFLNPPASRTAEHCARFWSTVQIPDEIFLAFRDANLAHRAQRVDAAWKERSAQWAAQWDAENPPPKRENQMQAWRDLRQTAWQNHAIETDIEGQIASEHPVLHRDDVSQAIRVAQMAKYAPSPERWPDEAEKIFSYPVETFYGETTVRDFHFAHHLGDIDGVLDRLPGVSNDAAIIQELRQLRSEMEGHSEQLGHLVRDNSHIASALLDQ